MEYPDSGVGLSSDRILSAHAVFLDESLEQAREDSKFRRSASSQSAEFDTILDLPDPYKTEFIQARDRSGTTAPEQCLAQEEQALREKNAERKRAREERRERQRESKHKEWWEVAGDWIGGAADVATQVVLGAAEEVVEAVTERPLETLAMVGGCIAIGTCITLAAPAAAAAFGAGSLIAGSVTLATDAAVIGLTTYGAIHASTGVVKAVGESAESADILMNKSQYSIAEIQAARENLQDKTGAVAIEAGFTLVTAPFGVGNAVRLSKGSGSYYFKSAAAEEAAANSTQSALGAGDNAVRSSQSTAGNSDNAVQTTRSATGTADKRVKGGMRFAEPQTVLPEMADAMLAAPKREAPWKTSAGSESDLKMPELPSNAGIEFLRRIDGVISDRQAIFDLEQKMSRLESLKSQGRPDILIADGNGGVRPMTDAEFSNVRQVMDLVEGTPQEAVYNKYFDDLKEENILRGLIPKELEMRRQLIEQTVNEHAQSLYPARIVPNIGVKRLDSTALESAAYGRGDIYLKDEVLYKTSDRYDEGFAGDTVDSYVHEILHGEQDATILRNLIDIVTGRDTTGRPLTSDEIDSVVQLGQNNVQRKFPRELVEDVNSKRAGRVLSPEEVARAEKLAAAKRDGTLAKPRHELDAEYLKSVEATIDGLISRDVPADFFSAKTEARLFGKDQAPDWYRAMESMFERHFKSYDGDYPAEVQYFADDFKRILLRELLDVRDAAKTQVGKNYKEYRNWHHEKEAFSIGRQAGKQVDDLEIMFGERLQSQVNRWASNPIQYDDVLAY
ncbi:MAG: hypothetical protein K2Y39_04195 [Candidatus Obscuribacterales bacterium]|nr:hypothetical protein [Candidatus Obscuribacterales bacterium]